MPVYDVECPKCGTYERIKEVDRRNDPCDVCGSPIDTLISTSTTSKGFEPYFDWGLGHEITGQGDRNMHMRNLKADVRPRPSPGDRSYRLDRIREAQKSAARRA